MKASDLRLAARSPSFARILVDDAAASKATRTKGKAAKRADALRASSGAASLRQQAIRKFGSYQAACNWAHVELRKQGLL